MRGLDSTCTGDNYRADLLLRVLPLLGHLSVTAITTGMIDRTSAEWETRHWGPVRQNTIAPLERVHDESVNDNVIRINPAKNRSRRRDNKRSHHLGIISNPARKC